MSEPSRTPRLLHLDALKALAAQVIMLHHLTAYGPIAEALSGLLPVLSQWFYDKGRVAVQVFLVVGGYLSARALSPRGGLLQGGVRGLLWRRYLRLVLPFLAAVGLVLACSALVASTLPELVPQRIDGLQLLSHALLLHSLLGHESLTVGAWYVAIDLQLFALMLALLATARGATRLPPRWRAALGPLLVGLLCAGAMLWFNRLPELDTIAPYFFGAYGLGALVHWLSLSGRPRRWMALLLALGGVALWLEFRERLALALCTAALLALWLRRPQWNAWLERRPALAAGIAAAGRHSYALFLTHFAVLLLLNAAFDRMDPQAPLWAGVYALAAWLLCNAASLPFHRWVERPAGRLGQLVSPAPRLAAR
ncbi:acyltransferase family protein [Pelomonas sp. CA6]|uniref:acyltransferase family protein n=1 Tax=Pelomonas sp. CA6 TaxID=2907999 RepID=UPI001F4B0131|nr:acyltransferase family protein [Pelomonas sp. CA6]MCH7342586.1 acyltransferase family protein [Pelomonas sp. CA6]